MTSKTKKTVAKEAYNKKLETPITYEYTWNLYATDETGKAEFVAAKAEMTLEEQIVARNTAAKANARSIALKAALDAAGIIKPTAENDPQVALKDMFKTLSALKKDGVRKYTDEQARALAADMVGAEWDEED